MPATDPRIDAYIGKSAAFAQPVLQHIRQLVHKACPGVEEAMKWSFPHFEHKGIICSMAAFKEHCRLVFWKAPLMRNAALVESLQKISSLKDMPSDRQLIACFQEAAKLNEQEVKLPAQPKAAKKELPAPAELMAALKKNKKALAVFEGFSPSHRREYIEWITEAKTDATRDKRIATTLEWLVEGKNRHWKYQK